MPEINALIEKLKAAAGPMSGLEVEECIRLSPWYADENIPSHHPVWRDFCKALNGSIDAALSLKDTLLPGQACAIGDMAFTKRPRGPWATIWTLEGEPKFNAEAATPPLAILIALLSALSLGDKQ